MWIEYCCFIEWWQLCAPQRWAFLSTVPQDTWILSPPPYHVTPKAPRPHPTGTHLCWSPSAPRVPSRCLGQGRPHTPTPPGRPVSPQALVAWGIAQGPVPWGCLSREGLWLWGLAGHGPQRLVFLCAVKRLNKKGMGRGWGCLTLHLPCSCAIPDCQVLDIWSDLSQWFPTHRNCLGSLDLLSVLPEAGQGGMHHGDKLWQGFLGSPQAVPAPESVKPESPQPCWCCPPPQVTALMGQAQR